MKLTRTFAIAAATFAAMSHLAPASADDLVKMTIGQRGNWDTAITHLGDKAGIFKKHGLAARDDLHVRQRRDLAAGY